MKVVIKNSKKYFSPVQYDVICEFIKLLQKDLPLNKDIHVSFDPQRDENMTTGVRLPHHSIHVLAKDRLLADVLRTVGHEWVHEYQHQKMGLKDTDKIQNIGGPEENMANVLAGIYTKKFAKLYPSMKKIMFGEQ